MNANQLIGRSVRVLVDDLFGTPVNAVIRLIDQDSKSMLLEFVPPVKIGSQAYSLAVARPRRERDDVGTLLKNGSVSCGITCVSSDIYDPAKPFDLSWWRGGAAAIADVVLY
jgi:hypothetical protein